MRYELWAYKQNNFIEVVVRDKGFELHRGGSIMLRDVSSYSDSPTKYVWKNASFPDAVWHGVRRSKGIKIAEAICIEALDANISWKLLNHLWETNRG